MLRNINTEIVLTSIISIHMKNKPERQDNIFAQLILIINSFYNHRNQCGHVCDLDQI